MFVRLFLYSESMSLESTKGLVAGHYCFVRKTLFLVALQCAFRVGGAEPSSKYPVVLYYVDVLTTYKSKKYRLLTSLFFQILFDVWVSHTKGVPDAI